MEDNSKDNNPFENYLDLDEVKEMEAKTSMVLDEVVERHAKEAVKINANTAKEFKGLLAEGNTPKEAAGKLGITVEDINRATPAGQRAIKNIIDEWSSSPADRKALTRGLLNKIAVEATLAGEFDAGLKAIDMIQADPEVGIKGKEGNNSMGGVFHPALLAMMNKMGRVGQDDNIQDAELVEGTEGSIESNTESPKQIEEVNKKENE